MYITEIFEFWEVNFSPPVLPQAER